MIISGVRVFLGTTYSHLPAMVFYVQQEPSQRPEESEKLAVRRHDAGFKRSSVEVKTNGKRAVREHIFYARL